MSVRQIRRAHEREVECEAKRKQRLSGRSKAAIAAGAGLGATVLFAPAAEAATFTVTNLNNDGAGSLRDAVEDANQADGDDVVVFQAGLTGTIELADDGSATGEDIEIYYDGLDIQGPGAGVITVDANDLDRVIYANDFDNAGEPLRIAGLTLTGGNAGTTNLGGAFYSDNSGGFAPYVTIADSVLTGNEAYGGGAIWADNGALTVTGSTISNNEATQWYGGGLYARGGEPANDALVIRNSTFSGNTAAEGAGGVYVNDAEGDVVIQGSTFSGNRANGDRGGGIKFRDNLAGVLIEDSTFAGNSADGNGGGIDLFGADTDEIVIARSTFSGNRADTHGGGILIWGTDGPVTITNTTVSGNAADADNDDDGYGGGIALYTEFDAGERAIRNSTITGNTAWDGGGIYNYRTDNAGGGEDDTIITSSIVANNVAENEGNDLDENPSPDGSFIIGFSLIEDPGTTATITQSPAGSNLLGVDPQLGPLQNNGGPTLTHASALTSPVLDAGIASGLTTDQRGAPRTFDAANIANGPGSDATDIGAVELLPGGRLALAQCKGATENVLFAPGTPIVGTDGNDVIVGTDGADNINSGAGADMICLGAGNDQANTGAGKDRAFGEAGKDRVSGKGGKDTLKGGAGKDTLKGQAGKDKLSGQGGADTLKGGGGADTLKGGAGKDKLRGGPGRDKLRGGAGKDSERQ